MSPAPQHQSLHARMENALRETRRHLALIERQIEARAERMTITSRTRRRHMGRGTPTWTRVDECMFHEAMTVLTLARRCEIDALIRKITRQESAAATLRHRLGIKIGMCGISGDFDTRP
jgi:hypothetical protein